MTKHLNPLKALEELLETYNTREIQTDKFRVGEEVTNLVLIFREGKFRSPRKIRGIIVERQMSVRYSTGYLVSGVNYVESREVCVSRRGSTVECCNGRFSPSPWRINQERSEGRGSGTWPSGWSRAARPCRLEWRDPMEYFITQPVHAPSHTRLLRFEIPRIHSFPSFETKLGERSRFLFF